MNSNTITKSYAAGSVTGETSVGGLAGSNWGGGTIIHCYAAGSVDGSGDVGGLTGIAQ